jgi:putative transposase
MTETPRHLSNALDLPLQAFDPKQEYEIIHRRLPHWSQPGTVCFITWRTWDSMPPHVIAEWLSEREGWLRHHGIDPSRKDWELQLAGMPEAIRQKFDGFVSDRWDRQLDAMHGACVLRQPALARIVADSLCHFDRERYRITDYVMMPNHVHLLAAFASENAMLEQCESWKHYTARTINRILGRKGRFWQQDGFDHLVRSAEWFDYYRRYIADNPVRARLKLGEYLHESRKQSLSDESPNSSCGSGGV